MTWAFTRFAASLEQDGFGTYWRRAIYNDGNNEQCMHLKFKTPPNATELAIAVARALNALNESAPVLPVDVLRERIQAIVTRHWQYINAHPALRDAIIEALGDRY